ncbi:helix-turn-helix domain-containing protein [Streptomyces sedi]|uniref:Helix-turn-helix domain-containing protein n=1 Tax=Streptomyces sedi TaxID=555059 RepID=A0A5C4V0A8_9ACTN|nr:helix-turn-helix transcriptional regulator [Streptomyces sedi]TNM29381.1 helix-turn-helix domain-containing protein [Streptomyces sedi]
MLTLLTSDNSAGVVGQQQRVAARIRTLREGRAMSLRQLSEAVTGYSASYLSRVETGKKAPSPALVTALDEYFGEGGALEELQAMSSEMTVARSSRSVVKQERRARRIRVLTSSLIPGLLQTEGYARELISTGLPGTSAAELEQWVASRVARQRIFGGDDPPFYRALIDESALCRGARAPGVMRGQLEHLLAAGERPRVAVQIIPFSAGIHAVMGGSITMLELADGSAVLLTESFDSGRIVDSPNDRARQGQRFDNALMLALNEAQSKTLITDYLKRQ